jgi:hypothetical protein
MADITKVVKDVQIKETIRLTVSFEYEIVNGEFETPEDKAHYEKYAQYISKNEVGE